MEESIPTREEQLARVARTQRDKRFYDAAKDVADGRFAAAERKIRDFLRGNPQDAAALRLLAELATRIGRNNDAISLLRRALIVAPGYDDARMDLVQLIRSQPSEALAHVETLLAHQPANSRYLELRANLLGKTGREDEALAAIEPLLSKKPDGRLQLLRAQWLRALGRTDEAIAAYRRATEVSPPLGNGWWGLANLKTVKLSDSDAAKMEEALAHPDIDQESRILIHYALGKAFEDAGDAEQSFSHYARANSLQNAEAPFDSKEIDDLVAKSIAAFSRSFFEQREGSGYLSSEPIFIVGMHRAGSTLLEQILSSHSQIEGTDELNYVANLARGLNRDGSKEPAAFVDHLIAIEPAKFRGAGEAYLRSVRPHRHSDKPFFIDKNPGNWPLIALIHLILPNARIIDIRRNPLDCGFSIFKQYFAVGRGFNDLSNIGRFYANYVAMMRHYDEVLPGRIHRIQYEALVNAPEKEVRRLTEYLGIAFEPACLEFYKNDRAVRTPSSEQVRQPINRGGIGASLPFERWLQPLKDALGPALDDPPAELS